MLVVAQAPIVEIEQMRAVLAGFGEYYCWSGWPDDPASIDGGYWRQERLTLVAEPLPHTEFLFLSGYFQPHIDARYDAMPF